MQSMPWQLLIWIVFQVHYTIDNPRLIFCNEDYTMILVQVSDIHIHQRIDDSQTSGVKHYFNGT